MPPVIRRKPRSSQGGISAKIVRLIYWTPLSILFLERLWLPFGYEDISSYLNVQSNAVTVKTKSKPIDTSIPSLDKLTGFHSWIYTCPPNTKLVTDIHGPTPRNPPESSHSTPRQRKIPQIVHQTARSRCVTPAFVELTHQWKFTNDDGWSYYFHDDEAVNRLLRTEFPEFPHLKVVLRNCVTNGTLKADLWRYLVLWAYGGVYADFDSAPTNEFNATTTIRETDDAFFVVEQYHILSQWFMAVSPRHPLMYYAIQHSLLNLMEAEDTLKTGASFKTGPHALHRAFIDFRRDAGVRVDPIGRGFKPVWSGTFLGTNNRTVTVVGVGENENQLIQRLAVTPAAKMKDYRKMAMNHFSAFTKTTSKVSGKSCLDAMLEDAIDAANAVDGSVGP